MVFSKNLVRLRGDRSQSDFARLLNLKQQTYARYEEGRIPKADVRHQMATTLGVDVGEILDGDVDKPAPTAQAAQSEKVEDCCTLVELENLSNAKLPHRVPCLSYASAGAIVSFELLPPDERFDVASDCRDPHAFALQVRGESMLPIYAPGDYVVVAPGEELRMDRLVVAQMRHDEGVVFKMLTQPSKRGLIRLVSLNLLYPVIERPRADFDWIWRVHAVIKPMA